MARNVIPDRIDQLFALAENMADGAALHGGAVGLLQNTEARIRADFDPARADYQAFSLAKDAKIALTAAQAAADAQARAFIGAAKNALMPSLGNSWSSTWATAGFIHSLAIPSTLPERLSLVGSLRDYFTANPAKEIAALNVTAAQAATRFTALSDAHSAANNAVHTVGQAKAAWLAARKVLEKRMRGLIDELGQLVEDDDTVWYAFGLTPPAAETTPDAPENLTLTEGPGHSLLVDWDDTPRADHYRVYVELVGGSGGFVAEPTTFADSDALLGPYPPGQTIRVKVSAVSGGLEGPASDVAEITLASGNGGGGNGTLAAPGQPSLVAVNSTDLTATWSGVPGAMFYNVYKEIGSGSGFVLAGPTTISQISLTGLPPGSTVRVRVTAANADGESAPSPHAEITLPAPPP